jgi:hypothetical protein
MDNDKLYEPREQKLIRGVDGSDVGSVIDLQQGGLQIVDDLLKYDAFRDELEGITVDYTVHTTEQPARKLYETF